MKLGSHWGRSRDVEGRHAENLRLPVAPHRRMSVGNNDIANFYNGIIQQRALN